MDGIDETGEPQIDPYSVEKVLGDRAIRLQRELKDVEESRAFHQRALDDAQNRHNLLTAEHINIAEHMEANGWTVPRLVKQEPLTVVDKPEPPGPRRESIGPNGNDRCGHQRPGYQHRCTFAKGHGPVPKVDDDGGAEQTYEHGDPYRGAWWNADDAPPEVHPLVKQRQELRDARARLTHALHAQPVTGYRKYLVDAVDYVADAIDDVITSRIDNLPKP